MVLSPLFCNHYSMGILITWQGYKTQANFLQPTAPTKSFRYSNRSTPLLPCSSSNLLLSLSWQLLPTPLNRVRTWGIHAATLSPVASALRASHLALAQTTWSWVWTQIFEMLGLTLRLATSVSQSYHDLKMPVVSLLVSRALVLHRTLAYFHWGVVHWLGLWSLTLYI